MPARKPRWCDAIPEATATIDCGGEGHPVTWRRGKLVLEAHDLSVERTMLAFGGDLCPCMRVLEMWVEQCRMPPDSFSQIHLWLGENDFLVPDEFELQRLLAMVLAWERAWRFESWLPTKQANLLTAELTARALAPLREHIKAWKPKTGARVISGCKVALLPSKEIPAVEGSTDRVAMRAVARLHPRWLVDVWPRGISLVDDSFVVDLSGASSLDDLLVSAVRWEPNGPGTWAAVVAPARVERDPGTDGPWRLTWEAAPVGVTV